MNRPPAEVPACADPRTLAPALQRALARVFARMRQLGFDPKFAETLRTDARQRFLYGFGRDYDDGRGVVTNSRDADETWHHFGLAADIVSASREWDAPLPFWVALGTSARAEGLAWGGDWRSPDRPHVQWGEPMRRSPSPRAARLYASGGALAVWHEVQADA